MKKDKGTISPFVLVLVPMLLGLIYLASTTDLQVPAEKYSASIHFSVPEFQVVVKTVFAFIF